MYDYILYIFCHHLDILYWMNSLEMILNDDPENVAFDTSRNPSTFIPNLVRRFKVGNLFCFISLALIVSPLRNVHVDGLVVANDSSSMKLVWLWGLADFMLNLCWWSYLRVDLG